MTLNELAIKYGTDKSSDGHFYTRHYEKYFEQLRDKPIRLFEIGIQDGKSLKMWREYFPNATIVGLDIKDCRHMAVGGIDVVVGSQSDPSVLKRVSDTYGPFDIIIDDGSHHNSDMKIGVDTLLPLLNRGGIYVVEDLHACYWNKTHGTGAPVFMDRLKTMLDEVNASGKSGYADIAKDEKDATCLAKTFGEMTWLEKNIEFVHLYRSIVFIKRYD